MTGPPSRVPVLLVLVWLGGLVAATSVGVLAVRLVAAQVGDPAATPLSAVAAASAAAASTTPPEPAPGTPRVAPTPPVQQVPVPPTSVPQVPVPGVGAPAPVRTNRPLPPPAAAAVTTPAAAPANRTFSTTAGTLGVQCTGTQLRLLYATPSPGYALDERGVTGAEAEVRFVGSGTRVRVRLSCSSGAPRLVEQRSDPDGGGDGGGGDVDGGADEDEEESSEDDG